MGIDMDAPFAEFAEKHLKTQKGNNSARTPGCNASPPVDQDGFDYEIVLAMKQDDIERLETTIAGLREALQDIYNQRGEDPLIASICSPLIDKTRPPLF